MLTNFLLRSTRTPSFLKTTIAKAPFFNQSLLPSLSSTRAFSEFFRERDWEEMKKHDIDMQLPKKYVRLRDAWQVPLEKKRLRRARKEELLEANGPHEPIVEEEKFIVHYPGLPLKIPTPQDKMFAVVNIKGRQYKVMQDDIIVTEHQKEVDINEQVVFDNVYCVGTEDYTLLGRPLIKGAKIWATVEQLCLGDKTLVFKKKRRKGYKKHHGFRAR